MRQIVSYILLLFYMSIIFMPALPLIDYAVNYKYISEELCVNKDKPEMHCNGKCHLKKEIKKVLGEDQAPTEKKSTLPQIKLKEYTNYYRKNIITFYFTKLYIPKKNGYFITPNTFSGYLPSVLKPPPFSSFI